MKAPARALGWPGTGLGLSTIIAQTPAKRWGRKPVVFSTIARFGAGCRLLVLLSWRKSAKSMRYNSRFAQLGT